MPPLDSAVPSPLVAAGTAAVRAASRLRGERVIHARGRTLTARLDVPGRAVTGTATGVALLDEPGTYDAVLRLSRSGGLPAPLPDVLGLAVRVLDAHGPGEHQDLLLDSCLPAPRLRRLPWPARDLAGTTFSTLVSYDLAGTRVLLGARPVGPVPPGSRPDDVPDDLVLALLLAAPDGPWREVARLTGTGVLPAPGGRRLRFSPATTGGGLRPCGPFAEWRRRAYPASHVAPDER